MIRAERTSLGFLTVLMASSLGFGCGGGSDGEGGGAGGGNRGLPTGGDESLALTFSPMYSAYEPEHDYKVPVVAATMAKVKFRALDPSLVDVSRTSDNSAMLTMKKAGDTTIIAELEDGSGVWGRSALHIAQATPELWKLGETRYENGVVAFETPEGGFMLPPLPEGGFPGLMFVDGGLVIPDGGFMFPRFDGGTMFMANPESACTYCHKPDGAGSNGGPGPLAMLDVEHTPTQIGGYSDQELINIFTHGMKPEGVPMRVAMGRLAQTWSTTHQWKMEEEAIAGIVVYIRSLQPKAQGTVDFLGGLFRGDGGFMLPPGLFGDGGFNIGSLFGEGGFNFGNRGDAGAPPPPPAQEEDAGETEADAGETMDAGAG
jgi:hypothetical protein